MDTSPCIVGCISIVSEYTPDCLAPLNGERTRGISSRVRRCVAAPIRTRLGLQWLKALILLRINAGSLEFLRIT